MKTAHIAGVIPARYASSRRPGKPLALIAGKSMIQRVYEQCLQSALLESVCVATDDMRIAEAVEAFNDSFRPSKRYGPGGRGGPTTGSGYYR